MRIKTIEIHNFRAFYGKHVIPVDGKNLFIYGENGSGKSSLYYALNDFFESAVLPAEKVQEKLRLLANVFTVEPPLLRVSFMDRGGTVSIEELSTNQITTQGKHKVEISNAFNQRGAYTYKKLYSLSESGFHPYEQVIRKIFWEFRGGRKTSFGTAFLSFISWLTSRETDYQKGIKEDRYQKLCQRAAEIVDLLNRNLPNFQKYFDHNLEVKFLFSPPERKRYWREEPNQLYHHHFESDFREAFSAEVKYNGRVLIEPQYFLNEARRSALSLAMIACAIKSNLIESYPRILLLDDIFIGMDSQNRKPFLRLLQEQFSDFQIIMMTYDRHWYEIGKQYLGNPGKDWGFLEFYADDQSIGGVSIPVPYLVRPNNYLDNAKDSMARHRYGESGNHLRKHIELMVFQEKVAKAIKFIKRGIGEKSQVRLATQLDNCKKLLGSLNIDCHSIPKIKTSLKDTLNPSSHHGYEHPTYISELKEAFKAAKEFDSAIETFISLKCGILWKGQTLGEIKKIGNDGHYLRIKFDIPGGGYLGIHFYTLESVFIYGDAGDWSIAAVRTKDWYQIDATGTESLFKSLDVQYDTVESLYANCCALVDKKYFVDKGLAPPSRVGFSKALIEFRLAGEVIWKSLESAATSEFASVNEEKCNWILKKN